MIKLLKDFKNPTKEKNTHRINEIHRRHKLGREMIATQIPHEISQSSWTVKSQQEPHKEYTANVNFTVLNAMLVFTCTLVLV